jgi:hypothetical protein
VECFPASYINYNAYKWLLFLHHYQAVSLLHDHLTLNSNIQESKGTIYYVVLEDYVNVLHNFILFSGNSGK